MRSEIAIQYCISLTIPNHNTSCCNKLQSTVCVHTEYIVWI